MRQASSVLSQSPCRKGSFLSKVKAFRESFPRLPSPHLIGCMSSSSPFAPMGRFFKVVPSRHSQNHLSKYYKHHIVSRCSTRHSNEPHIASALGRGASRAGSLACGAACMSAACLHDIAEPQSGSTAPGLHLSRL